MKASDDQDRIYKVTTGAMFGTTGLMTARLLFGFTGMGALNLLFSGLALGGSAYLSAGWKNLSGLIIKEIYLLDDGKHVEFVNYGSFNGTTLKISDLVDPENSESNKLKIKIYGTWVIESKAGHSFFVLPQAQTFHPDVLKAVLKCEEIDLSENNKKPIDI